MTTPEQRAAWQGGTPVDWASESHDVARDHAYKGVPADGSPPKLDEAYLSENRSVVEEQLEKGGLRLAMILNRAFASSVPSTVPIATAELPATAPAVDLHHIHEDRHERFALYIGVGVVLVVVIVNIVLTKRRMK